MKPDERLEAGAELFRQRNAVYGDNYRKVGPIMEILLGRVELKTADDYNRFHIFMLAVVKLTRYAENWSRGGHEDSCADSAVYWAMLASIDEEVAAAVAKMWSSGE